MAPESGTRAGEHLASAIGQGQEGNQGKISILVDLKDQWTYESPGEGQVSAPSPDSGGLRATLSQVPQGAKVIESGLKGAHRAGVTWASCTAPTPATSRETKVAWQVGGRMRLKLKSLALQPSIPLLGPGFTLHH